MNNRLRELRKERDWTQEQLAEKLGTTHSTIQRLESGKRRLDDRWILVLSVVFKCHPGELFAPLPSEGRYSDDERMAAAYARRIPPENRPLWFQIGDKFIKPAGRAPTSPRKKARRKA